LLSRLVPYSNYNEKQMSKYKTC